jgi:2'-5' RNA ligase
MRLFIAIPVEDNLKESLVEFQKQLKATQIDIRLVQPENIHLTLRFLGEVDEKIVPSITELMKQAVAGYQSFGVELKTIGAFPTVTSPRVIWVGYQELSNTDNTRQIYEKIENGLLMLGLAPDDHSFSPHITLARVKSSKNRDKLASLLKEKSDFYAGKQTIKEIILFQSQLHPTGPVYSVVYSAVLQEK